MKKSLQEFYEKKNEEHGLSGKGCAWDNEQACATRYEIACSMLEQAEMTIAEFGAGNGVNSFYFYAFNKNRYIGIEPLPFFYEWLETRLGHYDACKVVNESIQSFAQKWKNVYGFSRDYQFDYAACIGVYYLKLDADPEEYYQEALESIKNMLEMSKVGLIFNGFQDCVDFKDDDQFYFNMPRLLADIYKMGYSRMELISRPDLNRYEFFLKILKK
jgi:hypothetical protein